MIQLRITDALELSVETTDAPSGFQETSVTQRTIERANVAVGALCQTIATLAAETSAALKNAQLVGAPDMELSCGMKISATGDLLLAKSSAEAHLLIKLSWKGR